MIRRLALLSILSSLSICGAVNEYALILNDPSLAQRGIARTALESAEARRHFRDISAAQTTLRFELARHKLRPTGSVQLLMNAVFVHTTPDRVDELRALTGVQNVVLLPPVHRHLNRALDLVKAQQAWSQVGGAGNAGAGIKIAILDTGIDQGHPAFNDPSLSPPTGFPRGQTAFTNSKVIVARSYVAKLPYVTIMATDSRPDDISPRDRVGHGTNLAMIAAGTQNTGPLGTISGVAPKAWLGNYKIFGSPGVNDGTNASVVIQALEDAVTDNMDVAVLSLGFSALHMPLERQNSCAGGNSQLPSYIPGDACDVYAQAVEHAVSMGLAVVVSAGNDGDLGAQFPVLSTINSPGTAPSAITVGTSTNSHFFFANVAVNGNGVPSSIQQIDAELGSGPKPLGPITAPIKDIAQLTGDGTACSPLAAGSLTGSIALIQRGVCAYTVKVNNAQTAGAVAVLLYQTDATTGLFRPTQLTGSAIPIALIRNAPAVAIQNFLRSNPNATLTLDPALHGKDVSPDLLSDLSSRGPAIGTLAIKPDVVAPGEDLYTATQKYDPNGDTYDATGYTAVSGTSFSAAMVAGAVALVKQAHRNFTPAQLKSAVVNTATGEVLDETGATARVTAVGGGKLNAAGAVAVNATVTPATVSFGAIGQGALPINQTINVTNTSNADISFSLSIAQRDPDNNARVTVSPSSFSLPAGQTRAVTVQLSGNRPAPGSYEGQINITGGGSLHVPYLYLVGDGVPANIFPVLGDNYTGILNEIDDQIAFRVVDRYGVAVEGAAAQFKVISGGGRIRLADASTALYGLTGAHVDLGPQRGDQVFEGDVGNLNWQFFLTAQPQPLISTVIDAASFQSGRGFAPGSYIAIKGSNLSLTTSQYPTVYLPVSIAGLSVSFDVPSANISVPGHLWYASPTQVNVQIPWELQGQSSALVKVTINGISSGTFTISLADYGPGFFEFPDPATGQTLVAALDPFILITTSHPAVRGTTISLYANGLGPVTNQPASGDVGPAQPLAENRIYPVVTIGGRPAQVKFSGLAPFYVGLYQINVVVPLDAPTGVQPVTLVANGVPAKTSAIPVQ